MVPFKSPPMLPQPPECRGNPRLLSRGTDGSNPSPSSGESCKPSGTQRAAAGRGARGSDWPRPRPMSRFRQGRSPIGQPRCPVDQLDFYRGGIRHARRAAATNSARQPFERPQPLQHRRSNRPRRAGDLSLEGTPSRCACEFATGATLWSACVGTRRSSIKIGYPLGKGAWPCCHCNRVAPVRADTVGARGDRVLHLCAEAPEPSCSSLSRARNRRSSSRATRFRPTTTT